MTEGQTNYVQYLLPVSESGSRISEAKLTSKSLRKEDVWPPVEQMAANKRLPVFTSGFLHRKSYFGGTTDVQIA